MCLVSYVSPVKQKKINYWVTNKTRPQLNCAKNKKANFSVVKYLRGIYWSSGNVKYCVIPEPEFVSAEKSSIAFIENEEKMCGLAKEIKYKFPVDKVDFQNVRW